MQNVSCQRAGRFHVIMHQRFEDIFFLKGICDINSHILSLCCYKSKKLRRKSCIMLLKQQQESLCNGLICLFISGSQLVGCEHFGVKWPFNVESHMRYPAYQIFTLWFAVVAKFSCEVAWNNFLIGVSTRGGTLLRDYSIRKVENHRVSS